MKKQYKIKVAIPKLIAVAAFCLSFSFTLYAFLIVCRESLRLLSSTMQNAAWVFSENENWFYDYIYAVISLILGQSIFLKFFFYRNRLPFEKRHYKRLLILNDLRGLQAYFIYWFTKMSLLFVIFFGMTVSSSFNAFSFHEHYQYLFVFIIIVLFMQAWTSIRLKYKIRSLVWMLTSASIISVTAFGFSEIKIVHQEALNKVINNMNPAIRYEIQYPISEYSIKLEKQNLVEDLYLVVPGKNRAIASVVYQNIEYRFDNVVAIVNSAYENHSEMDRDFVVFRIHVDRKSPMKYVNMLKDSLSLFGVRKIGWAVDNPNSPDGKGKEVIAENVFNTHLPFPPVISINLIDSASNKIIVSFNDLEEMFMVNDTFVDEKSLNSTLMRLIENNPDYCVHLLIDDLQSFSVYISLLSHLNQAVFNLRSQESMHVFGKSFELLDFEDEKLIRKKYPLRFLSSP